MLPSDCVSSAGSGFDLLNCFLFSSFTGTVLFGVEFFFDREGDLFGADFKADLFGFGETVVNGLFGPVGFSPPDMDDFLFGNDLPFFGRLPPLFWDDAIEGEVRVDGVRVDDAEFIGIDLDRPGGALVSFCCGL